MTPAAQPSSPWLRPGDAPAWRCMSQARSVAVQSLCSCTSNKPHRVTTSASPQPERHSLSNSTKPAAVADQPTGPPRLTVQSVLHDTHVSPSGAKEMPLTAPVCPSSRLSVRLAGISQMRMPPSAVPDSRLLRDLGFLARHVMPSECVRAVMKGFANIRSSLAAFRARVYSWAFCRGGSTAAGIWV